MRISDWSSDVCSSDLQQNLLIEVANHLGYAPESIAVSLKTRKQVTLRGVIENGQKIVKCTRQKVTEQLPLSQASQQQRRIGAVLLPAFHDSRSEEHTSDLQSLMRITYAAFCLNTINQTHTH